MRSECRVAGLGSLAVKECVMSRSLKAVRKLSLMEIVGMLLLVVGLCFAVGIVGVAFDDQRAKDEKPKIQQSVEDMKAKLTAAKISDDQVAGLLLVHKSALVTAAVHQHFIITSFLVLLSLLVASFGFTLMLLGKLRTTTRQRDFPSQTDEPETANPEAE